MTARRSTKATGAVGTAFSRAGLMGNPSDGYGGRAIACPIRNFSARVAVSPSAGVRLDAGGVPLLFPDLRSALDGLFPAHADGLERLMLAALRRFALQAGGGIPTVPLSLEGSTTIPREVGLAGSSAMIIATIRALSTLWHRPIGPFDLAEMALSVEIDDLGIAGGPMDRVIQSYEQVLSMELAAPRMESGYRPLDPALLPHLLVAWNPRGGRSSGIAHGDLRERWMRGDPLVMGVIQELRGLVERGVDALEAGNRERFADLMDENFELRCRIFAVGDGDREMVSVARQHGGAGKLCGSGGAIVVAPRGAADGDRILQALVGHGFRACRLEVT